MRISLMMVAGFGMFLAACDSPRTPPANASIQPPITAAVAPGLGTDRAGKPSVLSPPAGSRAVPNEGDRLRNRTNQGQGTP